MAAPDDEGPRTCVLAIGVAGYPEDGFGGQMPAARFSEAGNDARRFSSLFETVRNHSAPGWESHVLTDGVDGDALTRGVEAWLSSIDEDEDSLAVFYFRG